MNCPKCETPLTNSPNGEMTCPTCASHWRDCVQIFGTQVRNIQASINQAPPIQDNAGVLSLLQSLIHLEQAYTEIIDELTAGGRIYEQQ